MTIKINDHQDSIIYRIDDFLVSKVAQYFPRGRFAEILI